MYFISLAEPLSNIPNSAHTDIEAHAVAFRVVMSNQTVLAFRGFKVRPQTLDNFLAMHGDTNGTENGRYPPRYQYDDTGAASDKVSGILRNRMAALDGESDHSSILVVVPSTYPHDRSPWVYVAYKCNFIYSQRVLSPEDLQSEAAQGFEHLRQEILACGSGSDPNEGLMGFYIVIIDNRLGPRPAELQEREKAPISCDICEEIFDLWTDRQWHRNKVHELDEDIDALPENA